MQFFFLMGDYSADDIVCYSFNIVVVAIAIAAGVFGVAGVIVFKCFMCFFVWLEAW